MALQNEYFTLNDGNKIPAVGLGTFQGSYSYESIDDIVVKAVTSAIDIGYRHFDTSPLYTTEVALGKALKMKIESGAVKREELFVVSKLWCTDHATKDVVPALKRSLSDLQLDYIDLWLVHWPISMPNTGMTWPTDANGSTQFNDDEVSLMDTWKGMEECKKLGLAKSIGVSNYSIKQIQEILDKGTIKPAVTQVEKHIFFGNTEVEDFCKKNDIHITCYSPLGKINRPWAKPNDPNIFGHPVLIEMGMNKNKQPGQVALRYLYQCGHSFVPKSSNPERQRQNLKIFDFELDRPDMLVLKAQDQNFRMVYLKEKLGGSKNYPWRC